MRVMPPIPRRLEDIDATWMRQALSSGGLASVPSMERCSVASLGDDAGALADIARVRLTFATPAAGLPKSVIVKLASPLRRNRLLCRVLSLYRREYDYYHGFAETVSVPTPRLYYGDYHPRSSRFVLVLEDLDTMQVVDQIAGPDARQARLAVRAIARLHARYWQTPGVPPPRVFDTTSRHFRLLTQLIYRASLRRALERTEDIVAPKSRAVMERYGRRLAAHHAAYPAGMRTLVHGDFRVDNMFFGAGEREYALIDWQASGIGGALYDVSYFLAGSLPIETRRRLERALVEDYHAELCRAGVTGFGPEDCWRGYRHSLLGALMPVVAGWGFLDPTNQRMTEVLTEGIGRVMTAIDDLDAHELMPG